MNKIKTAYPALDIYQPDGQRFKFGKEPVLRRMPDGSLFCMIYTGGDGEPSDENVVAAVRSYDDGATWTEPQVIFRSDTHAVWGTELFTDGDIPFIVIHTFHRATIYQELNAYRSFTSDCGKTWSAPTGFPGVPCGMSVREGKILSDGSWLFPVYWCEGHPLKEAEGDAPAHNIRSWGKYTSGVIRSVDRGETFSLHGGVGFSNMKNAWEPAIAELEPGHLRMFIRSDRAGSLFASDSFDFGLSWTSPEATTIPNQGAKVSIYRIDGKHVLFTNIAEPGEFHRRYLEAWISDDLCRTWRKKIRIAEVTDPEEKAINVTYPSGFADREKKVFYLAVDSYLFFFMMKIPFAEF